MLKSLTRKKRKSTDIVLIRGILLLDGYDIRRKNLMDIFENYRMKIFKYKVTT